MLLWDLFELTLSSSGRTTEIFSERLDWGSQIVQHSYLESEILTKQDWHEEALTAIKKGKLVELLLNKDGEHNQTTKASAIVSCTAERLCASGSLNAFSHFNIWFLMPTSSICKQFFLSMTLRWPIARRNSYQIIQKHNCSRWPSWPLRYRGRTESLRGVTSCISTYTTCHQVYSRLMQVRNFHKLLELYPMRAISSSWQ